MTKQYHINYFITKIKIEKLSNCKFIIIVNLNALTLERDKKIRKESREKEQGKVADGDKGRRKHLSNYIIFANVPLRVYVWWVPLLRYL